MFHTADRLVDGGPPLQIPDDGAALMVVGVTVVDLDKLELVVLDQHRQRDVGLRQDAVEADSLQG